MWLLIPIACLSTTPEPAAVEAPAADAPAEAPADAPDGADVSAEQPPPGVKAPGNLPVMTEAELIEAAEKEEACVEQCVSDNQMRAVSPQEIRIDCERECNEAHFTGQVEVVPDALPAPEDGE